MKIRYLSDLHMEFTQYRPDAIPSVGEDLVVLAGDVGMGVKGIEWAIKAFADRPVIYLLGNHEFYDQDFNDLIPQARAAADGTQVHLLEEDEIRIGGLRIAGCTLWTDFRCFGEAQRVIAQRDALDSMRDFELIENGKGRLMPEDTAQRCEQSRRWLERTISASDEPLLVVTHHAPSMVTAHPFFEGVISNAAFHSHFDDLIKPPVVAWIHGHTHYSWRKTVNGIPLITNQRGYPREDTGGFSWTRLIELDVSQGN